MTKTLDQMTDEEVLTDETLQMAVMLDRFHGYVTAPYDGRTRDADESPVQALTDAGYIQDWLDTKIPELVDEARKGGASWQEIGDALGMTRQGAQQRFSN